MRPTAVSPISAPMKARLTNGSGIRRWPGKAGDSSRVPNRPAEIMNSPRPSASMSASGQWTAAAAGVATPVSARSISVFIDDPTSPRPSGYGAARRRAARPAAPRRGRKRLPDRADPVFDPPRARTGASDRARLLGMKAPIPADEVSRLAAVRRYSALLDGADGKGRQLDDLTSLATQLCVAPIAVVSLVDQDTQVFRATTGLALAETSRDVSFCAHAILQDDVFVVRDATADQRFSDNPLVTGEPGIRFYAGAPLAMPGGEKLGTLCVIDQRPRDLQPEQADGLRTLSRQVVARLELLALRSGDDLKTRIIETSRDCVKVLDLDAKLLSMNAGGVASLEIADLQSVLGSCWLDFWHGADREAARAAVEAARGGGVGRFVGFFATAQTQQPRWWHVV